MTPSLTTPVIEEVRARVAMTIAVPHLWTRPSACWNCHWVMGSVLRNCARI